MSPAQPGAAQPGASSEQLSPAQPEAAIRIVSGRPGAEDVAALVAVLSALGGEPSAEAQQGRSAWSDPAWRLSGPQPRSGGWRSSGLPR